MSNLMAVLVDGVAQLEYDRSKPLPPQQMLYLQKMDEKMDEGIELAGEMVIAPSSGQRAEFVAANLANALVEGDDAMSAAMCSYLAVRHPDLKQVKIESQDGGMAIDLDFEAEYRKQVSVNFTTH